MLAGTEAGRCACESACLRKLERNAERAQHGPRTLISPHHTTTTTTPNTHIPLPFVGPFPRCSLGTLESTKEVYEAILDLRIATPQIVLNYASYMLENKFFEEAFRYAKRGPALSLRLLPAHAGLLD